VKWRRFRPWLILLLLSIIVGVAFVRLNRPTLPDVPTVNTVGADAAVAAAIRRARSAVASDPYSAKAWGELAMRLHANGFDEAADTCYTAAGLLERNNPDWPYLQGYLHHNGPGGMERAKPLFARAAALDSRSSMAAIRLADTMLALGELDAAQEQYDRIQKAKPGDPLVILGMAKLAVVRHQPNQALSLLLPLANDPLVRQRSAVLRFNLYSQLGDAAAATRERQLLAAMPVDGLRKDDPIIRIIDRQISVRGATRRR
jgi:Tfp pilus assembly protein PilF